MDEMQLKLGAALQEQKALFDGLMQRCLNLAAENAALNARIEALTPKPKKPRAPKPAA